ncbi:hypothetical protein ACLOJK_000538 [Asimina triloba]
MAENGNDQERRIRQLEQAMHVQLERSQAMEHEFASLSQQLKNLQTGMNSFFDNFKDKNMVVDSEEIVLEGSPRRGDRTSHPLWRNWGQSEHHCHEHGHSFQ